MVTLFILIVMFFLIYLLYVMLLCGKGMCHLIPRVKGIAFISFYYYAILNWNGLPPDMEGFPTQNTFRRSVKQQNAILVILWIQRQLILWCN